jgi:heme-degrading monooxygenase HmoA
LWILVGGSLQAIVGLAFHLVLDHVPIYTFVPVLAVLLVKGIDAMAVTAGLKSNPFLEEAILHRTAPQIPDADGTFSSDPGDEKIVVFLLGFKINHPLGILAPHIAKINEANIQMWKELDKTAPESGYYGSSEWTQRDPRGGVEVLTISYWRSTDDVHRFAYGPTHRKIWDFWNANVKDLKHLGIEHEIFEVDKHKWEGVYLNAQPTLMGATSFVKKGDKEIGGNVEDQWITSLLDASKGKLRTSAGRLGRDPNALYETYNDKPKQY